MLHVMVMTLRHRSSSQNGVRRPLGPGTNKAQVPDRTTRVQVAVQCPNARRRAQDIKV